MSQYPLFPRLGRIVPSEATPEQIRAMDFLGRKENYRAALAATPSEPIERALEEVIEAARKTVRETRLSLKECATMHTGEMLTELDELRAALSRLNALIAEKEK